MIKITLRVISTFSKKITIFAIDFCVWFMIELFIFHIHILAALYVFVKNWQEQNLIQGFLAIGVVALAFIIGWSLIGTLVNVVYPANLPTTIISKDAVALMILLVFESIFYYMYFLKAQDPNVEEHKDSTNS